MLQRAGLKFMALALLGLAVFAVPANAATIQIDPSLDPKTATTVALDPGNTYATGGPLLTDPTFTHYFKFSVSTPTTLLTITDANDGVTDPGILTVSWLDAGLNVFFAQVAPLNAVALSLATGIYYIQVVGQNVGNYTLQVTATPLPPALILFGTALAGLGWLGRRRRAPTTAA
jgi:hypothetical protein